MTRMTAFLTGIMLIMAMAATANALTLGVSTDGTTWQTVIDNGIGDTDTSVGSISYTNTTLTGFTKVKVAGLSENTLQSGGLFMDTIETSGNATTLFLKLSDFPYNITLPAVGNVIAKTGLTMQNGNASVNLKTYYGTAVMDISNLIADISLTSPGFAGNTSILPSLSNPFSLTEYLTINNLDGVTSQMTASLSVAPVPEPGTMALLGLGMLGLAIYGKRRINCKDEFTQ